MKSEIFPFNTFSEYSSTILWVKNLLEIALSLLISEIFTIFFAKIQDGCQKWRKLKFFPFAKDTLVVPYGSKIPLKSLYLLRFQRYLQFFHFQLKFHIAAKVAKIEIFPFCTEYYYTTLWVKNLLKIALSLMVFEIFVIFHIFTKSSNKVAITYLYIEQQV